MFDSTVDVEKDAARVGSSGDGAVAGETFEYGDGLYARVQRLAGKLHVEQRGIERVPEDERKQVLVDNAARLYKIAA